ncbi:hypothetical protein VKT23_008280 [Stygiomarasmius scandens]|uniref:Uncharacterized protein n=1 Tax=Marasmiellus scandens TaxID=2682957 RepID=A0ABR1JIY0_9AGAR
MMKIMGCENRILWDLPEISALADWKQRQIKDGKLSVPELFRRASILEESLVAPSQQTFSQFDNVEEDARYYASEIFRTAAIVYLRTVLYHDCWRVPDIETAVKDCVDAFKSFMQHRNDVRHAVVRSTVFAVFLCGCFTNSENDWEVLQNFSSEVGTVGNCMHVLELMKKVRAGRKKGQPVQWREALNKEQLFLVPSSPPGGTHWSRQSSTSVYQDPEYTEAPESDKEAVAHQTTTFLRDIANSNFVESTVHFVGRDQHQMVNNNNQQISESYNTYNVHNTGQFIEYVGQIVETTRNNDNRVTFNVNLHALVSDQAIIFAAGVGVGGFVTSASTSKLEASKQRESTAVIPFDPRHADFLANLILAIQLLPRALFRFCIYLYERLLPTNIEEA